MWKWWGLSTSFYASISYLKYKFAIFIWKNRTTPLGSGYLVWSRNPFSHTGYVKTKCVKFYLLIENFVLEAIVAIWLVKSIFNVHLYFTFFDTVWLYWSDGDLVIFMPTALKSQSNKIDPAVKGWNLNNNSLLL